MATLKETLGAYMASTLKMADTEISSLFNDEGTELLPNAVDTLKTKDAERVRLLTADATKKFENGYKKAQGEVMTKFEKEAREKYGIDSDKTGFELLEEIIAAKAKIGELEDEKVKNSPLYLKALNDSKSALKKANEEWERKYNDREAQITKEKTFTGIRSKAKEILDGLNPILPKDAAKADRQLQLLYGELSGYEFKEEGGKILVFKDGEPAKDEHAHLRDFESIVKEIAGNYWEFAEGENRSGSGNRTGAENTGAKASKGMKLVLDKEGKPVLNKDNKPLEIKVPANEAEFNKSFAEAKSAEERMALTSAWKEVEKGSAQ